MRYLFLLILLSQTVYADIRINEIMYNPLGIDSNKEFIEIFHSPWQNLSGYDISDGKNNETLIQISFNKNVNYSVIVETDTILNITNASIYVTDTTIGSSGLNNDETITLYFNSTIIDSVKINSTIANNNGCSMEYYNSSFYESLIINGTPGWKNSVSKSTINVSNILSHNISKKITFDFYLPKKILLDKVYLNVFKIVIKNKNCSEKENISYIYNITGNNTFFETNYTKEIGCSSYSGTGFIKLEKIGNYTICINNKCKGFIVVDPMSVPCNISIDFLLTKKLFDNKIEYYNTLSNDSFEYNIDYWIEDLYGNIIKKKTSTNNMNKKSYTPHVKVSEKIFLLRNFLSYISCNNTSDKIESSIYVPFKGIEFKNNIEIEEIGGGSSQEATFGDIIKASISVTKGHTSKNSIKAYVSDDKKKVSEISYLNIYGDNRKIELKIPIQLKSNCDNEYTNSTYTLYVKGLDVSDSMDIKIGGNNCDIGKVKQDTNKNKGNIEYNVYFPKYGIKNNPIETHLVIVNFDTITNNITAQSYIYRGSKSYSGNRTSNKVKLSIAPSSTRIIILNNSINVSDINANFKIKALISKNNQKTFHDYTKDIILNPTSKDIRQPLSIINKTSNTKVNITTSSDAYEENKNIELSNSNLSVNKGSNLQSITGMSTLYLSSKKKAQRQIPNIIIGLLSLLSIYIVSGKNIYK